MLLPINRIGKNSQENRNLIMTFSITLHHAINDGYHVDKF
ncbi:MAG: CatA-like O-acetyltransferase [Intestinibacter sp.]